MNIQKELFGRVIDAVVIASLIFGNEDVKLFGLWLAGSITVAGLILVFSMKKESADTYHAKGFRLAIRIAFGAGYTASLVLSGSPIWGAIYLITAVWLQVRAASLVKGES